MVRNPWSRSVTSSKGFGGIFIILIILGAAIILIPVVFTIGFIWYSLIIDDKVSAIVIKPMSAYVMLNQESD